MKLYLALFIFISCLSATSRANTLQARSCDGETINQKIFNVLLHQDSEGHPYLTMHARGSIYPYSIRVSSMGEGLALLGLIKSDDDTALTLLLVGDGFRSRVGGDCVFNGEYRVNYARK